MTKGKQRIIEWSLVIICIVGYLANYVISTERLIALNNTILKAVTKGDTAYTPVGAALRGWSSGEEVDVAAVREAVAGFKMKQVELLAEVEALSLPSGELEEELYELTCAYLKKNMEIADDYNRLADFISWHNPGTPYDITLSKEITKPNLDESNTMLAEFRKRQKELAHKHNFPE